MPLRLGLDFGTATTCLATVRDASTFRPEVISLDGDEPFVASSVFLDEPNGTPPIVPSASVSGRAPLALFGEAERRFTRYWQDRVSAQADGVNWYHWTASQNRERALLLTYFKPELADFPVRRPVRVPVVRYGIYDALSQSDDVHIDYIEREVATPEPDTDDLVASTAAIIRSAVERSYRQLSEKVSLLVIGLPSFGESGDANEASRAQQRRLDAVRLSNVHRDFGTHDFRVEFLGEAQAAAFSLDLDADRREVFAVIVDVGAGTTDLALMPFERSLRGRFVAQRPLLTASSRFAGRDLNLAVALALQTKKEFREAISLLDQMDRRAWQLVMDREVERIKRQIERTETSHSMRLASVAAHVDGCEEYENRVKKLRKVLRWDLSTRTQSLRSAVGNACADWRSSVSTFLTQSIELVGAKGADSLVSIELVGGAFRFEPFREVMDSAVRGAGLSHSLIRYRDDGASAQTAVARGLARWAAMQ